MKAVWVNSSWFLNLRYVIEAQVGVDPTGSGTKTVRIVVDGGEVHVLAGAEADAVLEGLQKAAPSPWIEGGTVRVLGSHPVMMPTDEGRGPGR